MKTWFLVALLAMPAAAETVWRYDVTLARPGVLEIEAWLPAHVHYQYRFDETGEAIVASPDVWLRPGSGSPDKVRVHFSAANGLRIATGMRPSSDGASQTYESRGFPDSVFTIFGRFDDETIGNIELVTVRHGRTIDPALIRRWVGRARQSVIAYYGRMPLQHVLLIVRVGSGSGIGGGTTMGGGGGAVMISAGESTSRAEFDDDWELTHEFVHLTFPGQERSHHWIEEGIATYVEPIARAQAGIYPVERIWRDLLDGLPKGEPRPGDRGLDRTHTWGRTYWGGALFCFVADVEIRKRTNGARGLQDALRAIMNAGGTIDQEWDISRTLEIGDAATGTHVLEETYAAMADDPHPVELEPLFKSLGVNSDGTMTDDAMRRAIERATVSK